MPIAVQPITPAVAALAADLGVALQPGSVVNATVLKVLDASLVRIAIGSLTLDAATMKPLQQGQALQLAVGQTADAITLTPVTKGGIAANTTAADDIPLAPNAPGEATGKSVTTLTPQETRVVTVAAQAAVTKQAGLSQLFANLSAAVESGALPRPVAAAAKQLLGLRQSTDPISGDDIRAGLESSGLLLESDMARPSPSAIPDLKSTLLVLKQALSTWTAESDMAATTPGTAKGAAATSATTNASEVALRATPGDSVADALQSLIGQSKGTATASQASASKNLLAMQLIASATAGAAEPHAEARQQSALPPPFRDGAPSPQAVASPSLAPDAEPSAIAHQLMSDTDSALARQTLLQIASLPDRIDQQALRSDPAQPRWNFEIPFVTPQGTAMAQFEIARDGGSQEYEGSRREWRARFSLNIEPAGPIHALITYRGEETRVKMWAERPATATQLRENVGQLSQSLTRAELKAADIIVSDGAPTKPRAPSAGQFLNRAT